MVQQNIRYYQARNGYHHYDSKTVFSTIIQDDIIVNFQTIEHFCTQTVCKDNQEKLMKP